MRKFFPAARARAARGAGATLAGPASRVNAKSAEKRLPAMGFGAVLFAVEILRAIRAESPRGSFRNHVCRDDSKIYRRMVATQNESRDDRLCLRRNAARRNATFAIRPY